VASRHGVFFSRREQQNRLAFVKQKPSLEELRELAHAYFYLMDSGIVLLNAATTMKLMEKAGWDETQHKFRGGIPEFYDLYSEMLTAFGSEALTTDPDLKDVNVKLIPLQDGEFLPFREQHRSDRFLGKTSEQDR